MRERRTYQLMIRLTPKELKNLKAACGPLGMTMSSYARTVLLRELSAAFPEDEGAKNRMLEQVAEMAGQVIREMSRGAVPPKQAK